MTQDRLPSFEERLAAARGRQGLDKGPNEAPDRRERAAERSALAMGLRVGMELVAGFAVAVAIGWAIDRWLHTAPWFMVAFMPLGFAAGIRNVWRLMGPSREGSTGEGSGGPKGPRSGGA
ncbi:MAG TPA: AtpZ/AtpI family protein [Acetobacteraceae bacterium]|nr:AtpZ/AtpI family protein [Acetobacteraceae bacterium]